MKSLSEEREEAAQAGGKAIRTAYLDGQIDAKDAIVVWLRSIPEAWLQDWGPNTTVEILEHVEGETWRKGPVREEDAS